MNLIVTTIVFLAVSFIEKSNEELDDLHSDTSKWSRRTARKRKSIGELLQGIAPPTHAIEGIVFHSTKEESQSLPSDCGWPYSLETLPDISQINWSHHPEISPIGGGSSSLRAKRKRQQIEAFTYLLRPYIKQPCCIVDAGSGSGALSIPLAHLLGCRILALDVNDVALDRLKSKLHPSTTASLIDTLCVDLASDNIKLPSNTVAICSLHACGAATDMAIELAIRHQLPFIVSPCCTAKVLTSRPSLEAHKYGPTASRMRSGSPLGMTYPRSEWLSSNLLSPDQDYIRLAKIADVGLGPQTPMDQLDHQRKAKLIVEMDRLCGVMERHMYATAILRMPNCNDYGKAEILIGRPLHHIEPCHL
jgi:Methyltransferase domain